MSLTAKKERFFVTTVRLPKPVYERAKRAINTGQADTHSFNDFVVQAVNERLRSLREQEIDAAIAEIANDPDYQRSAVQMAQEFERSDWDAFREAREAKSQRRNVHRGAAAAKANQR